MSVVPRTDLGKVQFYETHLNPWTTNRVALGLSTTDVGDLGAATASARELFNQQKAAQDAAKAATLAFNNSVRSLGALGSGILSKIKATADNSADPASVYVLAEIPPPAAPSPVPAPGTPTGFRVELLQSGALVLSWKCKNPPGSVGVIYEVRRRDSATGAFNYVGAVGTRAFTDDTIPAAAAAAGGVTYRITAVRSTKRGNPAQFGVIFGTSGAGGEGVVRVEESPRLAA